MPISPTLRTMKSPFPPPTIKRGPGRPRKFPQHPLDPSQPSALTSDKVREQMENAPEIQESRTRSKGRGKIGGPNIAKYNWNKLFAMPQFTFRKGEDYFCRTHSMIMYIRTNAGPRYYDKHVSIRTAEDGNSFTCYVYPQRPKRRKMGGK